MEISILKRKDSLAIVTHWEKLEAFKEIRINVKIPFRFLEDVEVESRSIIG